MHQYRIANRQHIGDLRGLGASFLAGARWNEAGVPALYFAASAAVAMLEMADDLPADWRAFPYPTSTQELGSAWLLNGEAELLTVPSTAIPGGLGEIVLASPSRLEPGAIRLVETLADLYSARAFAQT